jgi:uroporphyrinogen decarboxylase
MTMTSRERMKALFARELPDRMGLYEHFWGETLRDYWPEEGYPKDADPGDFFDYDIKGMGWSLNTCPFVDFEEELVEEADEWKVTKNARGATLKHWKEKSGTPEHIGFDCTTPEIWREKFREPLLGVNRDRIDFEATRESYEKAMATDKFVVGGNLFVYEILRGTLGDVVMLESMLLDPDWIKDCCQVYLDLYRTHYALLFDEIGKPDGMFIYEDLGYRQGLFASPATYQELIMPYHKALVDFFHDYGLPVMIHTCGGVTEAVPLIADAGYDMLQPMEAKAGCDVIKFAEAFRDRMAFMGNIDVTVLNTNDRAKVKAEIETKMKAMRDLGAAYIFHSDHSIPPDVRFETYQYALEVYRENAAY